MSERLTDNPSLFRLRVRYGKRDRLKYLGHLEVIHTIERIVRRAGLPYAVTQGFSPHMRVGFSSALPVGTSSTCEWYDLFMTEFVGLDEAFERLAVASPADLAPIEAAYIDGATPWQTFWRVKLPNLMPSITICLFLTLTNSFKLFDQNLALTAGEPAHSTEMLAMNIYQTFYARSGPMWKGIGQAKAVLFCILVIAISSLQLKFTRSKEVQQ